MIMVFWFSILSVWQLQEIQFFGNLIVQWIFYHIFLSFEESYRKGLNILYDTIRSTGRLYLEG